MADLAQLGIVINVSDQNAAEKLTGLSTAASNATSSIDNLEGAAKRVASTLGKVGGKKATDGLKDTQTATEKAHKSYLEFLEDINKLDREFAEIGKTQTGLKELQKNLNAIGTAATAAYKDGALVTEGFNDVGNASAKLALKIKEQKVALEALNSGYYDAQQTAAKDAAAKAEQLEMIALHTQALKENKEITERWAKAARENAALITQEAKERKAASDEVKLGILAREKERDIMGADNRRATILEIKKETESRKEFLKALKEEIIEKDKQTQKEQANITALNKFKEKQIALQKETALSYATADKEAQKYHETMGFLREAFDKIITRVGQFAAFLAAAAVVQAFTQAIKGAISVIIDFDQSLKSLEAIAGATATQASVMGDTIKQIAADTKFSAQEVAAGMETIGKAGFTAGESLAMIQDVANLATGAMEDLDKVSSLVITAINAFGMEVVQTAEITDIFANALIGSKLDVEDLVVAFNYVGAAGDQAGLSLNEVSGTLMVLSDNGLRASTMGTGLRKTLLSMLSPNKSLRGALDSVGMAYDDINTNIVGYEQALKNIAPLVWDFTNNTVDMAKAQAFFGTTASQVAAILIRETAQGGGISTAIKSTEEYGSALAMAQKQQEGLGVKTKNLQDHLKNVALAIGDAGLTQALHKLADALKFVISNLESLFKNYPVTQFAGYATAATAIAAAIYGIYNALKALVASSAFKMLFGGLFTTPLGLVTIAILGVATALTALYSRVKDAPKEFEKLTIEIDKQIANIESWRKVLAKASEEGLDAYESQIVKFISSNKELSKQILKSINERREAGEELYTSLEDLLLSAGSVKEAYKRIDEAMQLQKDDKAAKKIETMASAAQLSAVHFSNLEIKIAGTRKQLDEFYDTSDDYKNFGINGIAGEQLIKVLDKFKTELDGTKKILQQYGKDIAKLVMDRAELTNQTKEWGITLIKGLEESLGGEGVRAALEQFGILWELQLKKTKEKTISEIPKIIGSEWVGILSDAIHDMESKIPMLKIADYEKGKAELIKNLDDMREIIIKSDLFKASGVSVNELNIAIQGLLEQGLIDLVKGFDGVKTSTDNAKSSTEKLHEKIVELKEELSGADLSFATESGKLAAPLAETLKIFKEAGGSFGEFSDIILKLASDTDGLNLALEDLTMEGKKISFGGDLETVYNLMLALDAYKQKLEVYKYAIEVKKELMSEEEKFREAMSKVSEAVDVAGLSSEDAYKKIALLAAEMAGSEVPAEVLQQALKASGIEAGVTEERLALLIERISDYKKNADIFKYALDVQKEVMSEEEKFLTEFGKVKDAMDIAGLSVSDASKKIALLGRDMHDSGISSESLRSMLVASGLAANFTEKEIDELIKKIDDFSGKQQDAYDELYDGIYGFTREVISDWDDMGNTIVDIAEDMVKDIIAAFVTQKIAIPIYMYAADMAGISTGLASDMSPSSGGLASMTSPISSLFTIGKTAYTLVTEGVSAAVSDLVGADLLGSISSAMFGETAATAAAMEFTTISPTVASTIESAYAVANGGAATTTSAASGLGAATAAGLAVAAFMAIDTFLGSHDQADPDIYVQSPTGGLTESTATYTVSNRDAVTDEIVTIFDAAFASLDESLDANIVDAVTASAFRGKARITDLDETDANALINALVESAFSGDYTGSIASFEGLFGAGSGTGYKTVTVDGEDTDYWNNILTPLTEAASGQYSKGLSDILMEAIGLDSGIFDFDFLKSLQAEGENLFDTFANFAIVVQDTDGFVENITRQMDEFGFTVEEAFTNILVVISVLDEIQASVDALATTSSVAALNTLTESWYALIDSLEAAYATTTQITEAETAMAQVLGANITGLTADALQSALSEGGDIESILQTSIQNAAYADIAQKIAEEYISGINEQIGQVWIDTGGDLEAVAEAMQDIDTTEAQAALEELQESFGLLAESANDALDTAEAMRIVTLAIEGQLTVAQKFEEWQIENIEAMNLFSEMAANSVTADELESAVDAFAALGIEGDDLSNVIQDLADTFTEAAQQMYENISDIESAQGDLIGSEESTEAYLNSMKEVVDFFKDTPSLSQIRGDESVTTTEFDEEAYREDIAAAVVKSEYQSILGRNPDSDYWQNELIDGDIVMSSIHDAILAAISEPEDVVEEIYNRLFGHSADSAGLAYWLGELESGALSISGLESALIAGAQGSDIDYYNENKGKVEITNWKDFETAAGLLGLNADNYYNEITSTRTGEFSTSEAEVEAALSLLNDLPDIIDSSGNLISSALDEFVNAVGTMDSAVLEDIFGSAASEQISAMVSAISDYESSIESDSGTSGSGTSTDDTQDQIDAIFAQIQEGIDTINLSDFEKEIYDINKQAQEWTDSLAELGVTASEDLAIIEEWVAAQRNALAEGIAEEWQNIINENSLSDTDLQLIELDAWFDEQKAAATELGMSLDTLTEAYDLQKESIEEARQSEINSILESANDYLNKSGMSEFESQMIDLEKESESLTEQLTELNATESELAVVTEWLAANEQALIDARQEEIDAFNKSIQDIISKNTLSDLEYELEGLTDWYEEQKAAAEDLGIALDAVNKAYELQKEAAYEASVTAARTTYIESLQEEQTILEDTLSLAKENYINGLNDEIDALNETASEAEKTADSFESLLETINALQYSSVTDSDLNPDTQMAFVGAELAAAMAKIQSGDAAEIQAGMEDLPTLTSDFLELSKQTSGSFSSYQNDFAYVMRILNEAEQIAGDQKSTAELSLDELTSQTAALEATLNTVNGVDENLGTLEELEATYNSAKTDLDNSWYQDEIDRLTEINSSVLSLEESFIAYMGALSSAVNAGISKYQSEYADTNLSLSPGPSSVASTPSASESNSNVVQTAKTASDLLYDRAATAFASGAFSSGTYANLVNQADSMGQLGSEDQLILDSYLDRYGFKTGGTVTGPDSGYFMPTTFHGTEHITPDSEMTEVKEVLGEVKDILLSIRDTGGNVNKLTIQTNRLLDRVTQGGTEMRVKEIA